MKILRSEMLTEHELLRRIKKTRLRGHGQAYIYANSTLELQENIDPNTLVPAQRYVLESNCHTIEMLHKEFLQHDINIFALKGCLMFWVENPDTGEEDGPIPLIPPVIETSIEANGKINLINDGMHRVYTAKKLGLPINIIFIDKVPLPYYAYPLDKGWNDVIELKELRENFLKKEYRDKENYKDLFRNFNEVLPGIQKQR